MKRAEGQLLERAVEVGAWKLEHDKEKVRFSAGVLLTAQVARLVEIMPEYGVQDMVIYDLVETDFPLPGSKILFSLRAQRTPKDKKSRTLQILT